MLLSSSSHAVRLAIAAFVAVWIAHTPVALALPAADGPVLLAQSGMMSDPNFVADAVERVGPAVVRINASRTVRTRGLSNPFFQTPPNEFEQRGEGSGFIVTHDGLVLTNAHVVAQADAVEVVLVDGRQFEGQVLGADPLTDVAVVKIDATDLPVVTFGDSEQLTPGEWAIAIGNPLGLDNTVTVGIISAVGRSAADVGIPMQRAQFIQTDAAINPGNSGGPLLDERGDVIAMNTAIIRGANGIGFAVPIATAQRIANQLVANGRVSRAYLGIRMSTLTPELRDRINDNPNASFRVVADEGVLVQSVSPNGPAAQGGIRAGDAIVAVGNRTVEDSTALQQLVEQVNVGDILSVSVNRNGRERTFQIETGEFPEQLISQ